MAFIPPVRPRVLFPPVAAVLAMEFVDLRDLAFPGWRSQSLLALHDSLAHSLA